MKLTEELLRKLVKEEIKDIKEVNPLGGNLKTAATPEDERPTVAPNPLGGNLKTAATPEDERPTVVPNPLGGDRETTTPDNPQGIPLVKRVANVEKIIKQLVARIK